jgi:hypothetical protein
MRTQRAKGQSSHQRRRLFGVIVGASVLGNALSLPAWANSAADAITARITAQAGQPEDFTRDNDTRGREQKANQSRNGANTGAIVAAAAGAALVAVAVPKLASGIPWEVAVGAALMANAGLEFAQSAASARIGAENGDQYRRLTVSYDESRNGGNAQGPAQIQEQVAQALAQSPELQNVLSQRGVDINQFAQQLASGQLQSIDAVLGAMKNDVPIDAATRAQAEAVANMQATQAIGEAMAKVQLQESAQPSRTASVSASGTPGAAGGSNAAGGNTAAGSVVRIAGSDAGGAAAVGPKSGEGDWSVATGPDGNRSHTSVATEKGVAGKAPHAAKVDVGSGGLGGLEDELLNRLMSSFGGAPKKREDTAVSEKERDPLLALGVRRPVGKMTLFQLAHRNYRSYREWRTRKRLEDRAKRAAGLEGASRSHPLALKTSPSR